MSINTDTNTSNNRKRRGPASRTMPKTALTQDEIETLLKKPDSVVFKENKTNLTNTDVTQTMKNTKDSSAFSRSTRSSAESKPVFSTISTELSPTQVTKLEEVFVEKQNLSRSEKRSLASKLKLQEVQVSNWFERRRCRDSREDVDVEVKELKKAVTPLIDLNTPEKRVGVTASKRKNFEVVELDDTVEDNDDEPLIVVHDSKQNMGKDVKLSMGVSNVSPVKNVIKREFVEAKKDNLENELVAELRRKIKQLETELMVSVDDLLKVKKVLDTKSHVERTLAEKDEALKIIEASMPKMLEEHKKIIAKYEKDIKSLKTSKEDLANQLLKSKKTVQSEVENAMKESKLEMKNLKSKVKDIELMKNSEMEAMKTDLRKNLETREEEIKSLKEDLKKVKLEREDDRKYVETKEEKIRLLKDDLKKAKIESENDWKALRELKGKEWKIKEDDLKKKLQLAGEEIKAKDGELKKKLLLKDDEMKQKIFEKNKEHKQSIERKDMELKEDLLIAKQDYNKAIKSKEAEFAEKLVEFERLFKQKDEEVLRINAELSSKNAEINSLKQQHKSGVDLEVRTTELEKKVQQEKRDNLDLKFHQRKLEAKITEMEDDVIMVRAEMKSQTLIKTTLMQKVQTLQKELEEKCHDLEVLRCEKAENTKKLEDYKSEELNLRAEIASMKIIRHKENISMSFSVDEEKIDETFVDHLRNNNQPEREKEENMLLEEENERVSVEKGVLQENIESFETGTVYLKNDLDLDNNDVAKNENEVENLFHLSVLPFPVEYVVNTPPRSRKYQSSHRLEISEAMDSEEDEMTHEVLDEIDVTVSSKRPLPFSTYQGSKKIRLSKDVDDEDIMKDECSPDGGRDIVDDLSKSNDVSNDGEDKGAVLLECYTRESIGEYIVEMLIDSVVGMDTGTRKG